MEPFLSEQNADEAKLASLMREYSPPPPRNALAERIVLAAKRIPQGSPEPAPRARGPFAWLRGGVSLWWAHAGALAAALLLGYLAGSVGQQVDRQSGKETASGAKALPLYSVLIPEDEGL